MIVADNGSSWYLSGAPSDQWSDDDLHNLSQVIGSNFQVVNLTPVVSALQQTAGPTGGGTSVTLSGINFSGVAGQIQVNFGSTAGTDIHVINDNTLTVTAPAHAAGIVDVTVITPYGTSTTSTVDRFTYNALAVSSWKTNASGDWNTSANWNGGIPNSSNAEADFLNTITSPRTISTAASVTAAVIRLNSSISYTLAGSGPLTLQSTSGPALLYAQAGSHIISVPIILAGSSQFNVDGGASLTVNSPISANSGATLTLSIANASEFTLADHGVTLPQVLQLSSLSIAPGGALNLDNNDLDIQLGDLGAITALLSHAFGAGVGAWTGSGINSTAAAADTTHLTALGVILNTANGTTPLYGSGTPLGLFDGTAPAATDALVKYTYYGDVNLDGKVDGSDYARIDNGNLNHLTGWYNGDFNYDGVVDGSDYTLIDNAFNSQGARILSQTASPFSSKPLSTNTALVDSPSIISPSTTSWLTNDDARLKHHHAKPFFDLNKAVR